MSSWVSTDPEVISEEAIDSELWLIAATILVTIVLTIKAKIVSQAKYTTN